MRRRVGNASFFLCFLVFFLKSEKSDGFYQCFISDCTGSMGSYIKSTQDSIRSIMEQIMVHEKCDVRFSLLEYRDHPPQDSSFAVRIHPFTSKIGEVI